MLEDVVTPVGPYRLRLMCRSGTWRGALVDGSEAVAHQRSDGAVVVRATSESGLATARFMLALEGDTAAFHRRFNHDPLLGATARAMVGYRPLRLATVAHSALRAVCGQLIEARKAAALLAPYEEWQGLAGQILMLGWSRGLIPGADPDVGRRARLRTRRAA